MVVAIVHPELLLEPAQKPDARRSDQDYAAELPFIPPKTPAESLKTLRVRPGFRVELAAAEPLLASPVALDFDEDGRLYVAEYPEYNQYASKTAAYRAREAASLYGLIYPERHLQERLYSFLPFLAKHGLDLTSQIYDAIQLDCPDHRLMVV